MRILFTAHGKEWDSKVDQRFGRADGFLLFNEETNELSWHDNAQNIHAEHGAGIQAGQHAVNLKAEVLITGNVGPKAFRVLNSAGIEIYTVKGELSVKEALTLFREGKLEKAENETTIGLG